ncbi:MAG: hypothetical protein ACTIJ6_06010 [Leucobacter sp.]
MSAPATESGEAVSWHWPRLITAWAVAAVIGILVTVFTDVVRFPWLVLAIGVSTLVSFALQLGTAQREGFISRLAFSIAGSVVVIAIIDLVGALIGSPTAS